jgi:chromosome partitioning protein
LLTLNGLCSAHGVIVPMECEYFALRGVALLKDTIDKVSARLNPDLSIIGVVATMYDSRTLHSREVLETVQQAFGDLVFITTIARTIKFPDAAVSGTPITVFAPESSGAEAYRQLAREVLSR